MNWLTTIPVGLSVIPDFMTGINCKEVVK